MSDDEKSGPTSFVLASTGLPSICYVYSRNIRFVLGSTYRVLINIDELIHQIIVDLYNWRNMDRLSLNYKIDIIIFCLIFHIE